MLKIVVVVIIIALVVLIAFLCLLSIVMDFSEEIEKRKKHKKWSNYTPLAEDARAQRYKNMFDDNQKIIKQINILLNKAISKGDTHIEIAGYDLDLDNSRQIPFDMIKDYYESFDYEVYRDNLVGHVIIRWNKEDE